MALLPNGTTKFPSPADPTNAAPVGGSTFDGSTYVSSGFLAGGATYSLRFTKAATYAVHSLIHQPEMVANIVVQPARTPYAQLQGAYDGVAATQSAADLASAQPSVASYPFGPGGTHFAAGIAPGGRYRKACVRDGPALSLDRRRHGIDGDRSRRLERYVDRSLE